MVTQREASLGIFHAVGRVVYNKRDEAAGDGGGGGGGGVEEQLPPYLLRFARPKRSQVSVSSLMDETGTDTQTFISALHENYVLSCESSDAMDLSTAMDYADECMEHLSASDLLCPSRDVFFGGRGGQAWRDSGSQLMRQDEMAFEVAVRGMLFSLPSPVKRKAAAGGGPRGGDAFKMFYPTSLKLWRAKEEMEGLVKAWRARLLAGQETQGAAEGAAKRSTDGASAFRKPPQKQQQQQQQTRWPAAPRSPRSWTLSSEAKRGGEPKGKGEARGEAEEGQLPPPGSAARGEMLLDRLPYMAQIARARGTRGRLRELERLTSFGGIGGAAGDDDDDGDDDDGDAGDEPATAGEAWATDRPSDEPSPRRRRAGIRAGAVSGMLAQKLVLSDDDIED